MSLCEACERGDHANCNLASWCQCDDPEDGDELAGIADRMHLNPEQTAAVLESSGRALDQMKARTQAMVDDLNPTERAILERRFKTHPPKNERF